MMFNLGLASELNDALTAVSSQSLARNGHQVIEKGRQISTQIRAHRCHWLGTRVATDTTPHTDTPLLLFF